MDDRSIARNDEITSHPYRGVTMRRWSDPKFISDILSL